MFFFHIRFLLLSPIQLMWMFLSNDSKRLELRMRTKERRTASVLSATLETEPLRRGTPTRPSTLLLSLIALSFFSG